MWKKYIINKNINILCPGNLLEAIVASNAHTVLERNGLKIDKWICPIYYQKALKLFGINAKIDSDSKDTFNEFYRLLDAVESYPTPVFFDKDKNVYFNMMYNYGIKYSTSGYKLGKNEEPFWKQILNNLCCYYPKALNKIDLYEAKSICNKYLKQYDLSSDNKYVLIDVAGLFGIQANRRTINSTLIFPPQMKKILETLKSKGIEGIVISNVPLPFSGIGINKVIPSWNLIDSDILISLLACSYGIISSDQNLYLLGAMMEVKNIICLDDMVKGWSFNDLDEIMEIKKNYNWVVYDKTKNIMDVGNMIKEIL